jgi:hypothetical protein
VATIRSLFPRLGNSARMSIYPQFALLWKYHTPSTVDRTYAMFCVALSSLYSTPAMNTRQSRKTVSIQRSTAFDSIPFDPTWRYLTYFTVTRPQPAGLYWPLVQGGRSIWSLGYCAESGPRQSSVHKLAQFVEFECRFWVREPFVNKCLPFSLSCTPDPSQGPMWPGLAIGATPG